MVHWVSREELTLAKEAPCLVANFPTLGNSSYLRRMGLTAVVGVVLVLTACGIGGPGKVTAVQTNPVTGTTKRTGVARSKASKYKDPLQQAVASYERSSAQSHYVLVGMDITLAKTHRSGHTLTEDFNVYLSQKLNQSPSQTPIILALKSYLAAKANTLSPAGKAFVRNLTRQWQHNLQGATTSPIDSNSLIRAVGTETASGHIAAGAISLWFGQLPPMSGPVDWIPVANLKPDPLPVAERKLYNSIGQSVAWLDSNPKAANNVLQSEPNSHNECN